MKDIGSLLLACLVSLVAYVFVFGFVVERPLVIDVAADVFNRKLAYAARAPSPKMFILAGSNARFSHSCAVLEEGLGTPCVNLGVSAGIGIDWEIDKARPYMRPGDLVYIPLEYDLYTKSRSELFSGADAAYRFRHDKRSLLSRGPEGLVRAAFLFDLGSLIQSVGEMALSAAGVTRRFGAATMDVQGDEIDHGDLKAKPYEYFLRMQPTPLLHAELWNMGKDGSQVAIGAFLDWCRANGIVAVGGLPTTFDDLQLPPAFLAQLEDFYRAHGATFIILPNRSQYPRRAFFDTPYHLRDRFQEQHSRLLVSALRPRLPAAPVPAQPSR